MAGILDFATQFGCEEQGGFNGRAPLVEDGADFIVNARMARGQHMWWSNRGAFQVLQARTADINGTLERHFKAACPTSSERSQIVPRTPSTASG